MTPKKKKEITRMSPKKKMEINKTRALKQQPQEIDSIEKEDKQAQANFDSQESSDEFKTSEKNDNPKPNNAKADADTPFKNIMAQREIVHNVNKKASLVSVMNINDDADNQLFNTSPTPNKVKENDW